MIILVFRLFRDFHLRLVLVLSIYAFTAINAVAQDDIIDNNNDTGKQKKYLDLSEKDDILEVSLKFDLANFLKKPDRSRSFDGIITIPMSETDTLNRKVIIRYRGESRYERCSFPPMRVTLKKPVYEVSGSGRIKKIKLVNQCNRGSAFEEYIIWECLVYKIHNVITDTSYRVRLIKVNFIDKEDKRKPLTQFGIFIEPKDLLAKRTNTVVVNTSALTQRDIIPEMIDMMAIFNYMVSNWDWSVPGQHNLSILKTNQFGLSGLGIPVPFDFDLTGIVNADYAIPPPALGIESNRDRIFTRICRPVEVYRKALMKFIDKKEEIYSVGNDYPYLSRGSKRDIIGSLDQFYNQLENQRSIDRLIDRFNEQCKKL